MTEKFGPLTVVEILFQRDRRNYYITFGKGEYRRLSPTRAEERFAPGQLWGYVRWEANEYGTQHWEAWVLRAGAPGQEITTVPGVQPGAQVILCARGAARVHRYFESLDMLDNIGIPHADVSASYWRRLSLAIYTRVPAPPYTQERHAAYLARRSIFPCE